MIKIRISIVLSLCLVLAAPMVSLGFDCNNPQFGADLEELNQDNGFVKYLLKGGVSYYNYTGVCRMTLHEKVNPAISWAFIQNKLYARIIKVSNYQQVELERWANRQYGPPDRLGEEGDWKLYIREFKDKNTVVKIKYNKKTKELKSTIYYEPLRAQLDAPEQDLDPPNQD